VGNRVSLIEMGILRLPVRKDSYERLKLIHQKVLELIGRFAPQDFAIEAPFFGKNVQSMLKLGRAQGVAIAVAMHAGIPVTEYSPKKVKQSITGNGNSEKEQVWKMLQHILELEGDITAYDASDALAVAVCHHFQAQAVEKMSGGGAGSIGGSGAGSGGGGVGGVGTGGRRKKPGSWEDFIRKNPGKVH
jgi:crossover junction endodeoxyribonuclease RuvC